MPVQNMPKHSTAPDMSTINNFLLAVVSCEKHIQKRVPYLQKYCINSTPHIIFTGSNSNVYYKNQIILNCGDGYHDLKLKTLKLIEWFLTETDKEFLIKIDDDCFIDTERLDVFRHDYAGVVSTYYAFLKNKMHHLKYIKNKCSHEQIIDYDLTVSDDFKYAEGGCYVLSRKSCKLILEMYTKLGGVPFIQEDMAIGYLLNVAGVEVTDYAYSCPWYDINRSNISFHPCSLFHMHKLASCVDFHFRIKVCNSLLRVNPYYAEYFKTDGQIKI